MKLTAVILTLNEEEHIKACIESLEWTDDVLVFDSFSEDGTVAIAQAAGATVLQNKFENYAQQRNDALDSLPDDTDWVFFVDADERSTPELAYEIRKMIGGRAEAGWYVSRYNYIFGKVTLGAGWYPDYQLRLFRNGRVHYERPVHETAVVDGGIGHLANPLIHYNYRDVAHFRAKQKAYSSYDASILYAEGMHPKIKTFLAQPVRQFYWRFITLHGYRIGWHGFRLSAYMAYYEWVKYKKVAQLWRADRKENE